MGLVASQGRLLMLTARKSDLEFQMQTINQMRMMLSQATGHYFNLQAGMAAAAMSGTGNWNPQSPEAIMLQSELSKLQQIDKIYEMQFKQIETQHKMVANEMEAVQKVVDKNTELFKNTGYA